MEIAIISGKGGTGKSSVSAAFAALAQQAILCDCDVDAANQYLIFNPRQEKVVPYISSHKALIDADTCIHCNTCRTLCRYDAIQVEDQEYRVKEINCEGCGLCARVCPEVAIRMVPGAPSYLYSGIFRYGHMSWGRLAPGEENSGKLVGLIREEAKEISRREHYDRIILDGPPGIGCPVISSITGVDRVLIVTEPSLSGLSDLERALDISSKFRLPTSVVINKFNINPPVTAQINDYCHTRNIQVIGHIPYDQEMVHAMIQGQTIIEHKPLSETAHIITGIFNQLIKP
jgi:MinD superfamily P-loop ATPase